MDGWKCKHRHIEIEERDTNVKNRDAIKNINNYSIKHLPLYK
jgi:hypothetical protein